MQLQMLLISKIKNTNSGVMSLRKWEKIESNAYVQGIDLR